MPITDPAHLLLEVQHRRRFFELDALPCLRSGARMRPVSAKATARMPRRLRRSRRGSRAGPQAHLSPGPRAAAPHSCAEVADVEGCSSLMSSRSTVPLAFVRLECELQVLPERDSREDS